MIVNSGKGIGDAPLASPGVCRFAIERIKAML